MKNWTLINAKRLDIWKFLPGSWNYQSDPQELFVYFAHSKTAKREKLCEEFLRSWFMALSLANLSLKD